MEYAAIKQEQMDFFLKSKAGCAFAAFAAKRPEHYGWRQYVIPPEKSAIAETLDEALADADVTMVSLIFPKVDTANRLLHLIDILPSCPNIVLEQDEVFDGMRCLGFRLQLGHALSWMSGFGSFEFLPKTRQTPFTEVAVRVKPRPDYDWVFEEHPDTTVHIGDLDMKGLSDDRLQKMWESSFLQVERLLGHKPDLKSAAKTTFAIPISLW